MDNTNRASRTPGKSWIAVQILDDISDNEKNLQMYNISNVNDLKDKDCRAREFDTDKIERVENAWCKLDYN